MRYIKNILLILSISFSIQVVACDCKNLGPLDSLRQISFNESDFVFLGELIELDTIDHTYTFRIIESFKGENKDSIIKGKYFDSCSKFPRDKSRWIVYADLRENLIDINQCLASRSELNPICIFCYEIPPPVSNEIEKKEFEKEMTSLKNKALEDWTKEIEILRKMKR
jgi:hypothetical protein